jgi:hypothetical protein
LKALNNLICRCALTGAKVEDCIEMKKKKGEMALHEMGS